MLSLGRIVISDLGVADLFMHSLSGMILLYLAAPIFTLKVFLHDSNHTNVISLIKCTIFVLVYLMKVAQSLYIETFHNNILAHNKQFAI